MTYADDGLCYDPRDFADEPGCGRCEDSGYLRGTEDWCCSCERGEARREIDRAHDEAITEDESRTHERLLDGRGCPDPECGTSPCVVCRAERVRAKREYDAAVERLAASRLVLARVTL